MPNKLGVILLVRRCAFCGPEDDSNAPGVCIAKAADAEAACSRLDPGTWNASTVSSSELSTAVSSDTSGNSTDVQVSTPLAWQADVCLTPAEC